MDDDFVSIVPKDETYEVRNHNGATMGFAKKDSDYWWFYPREDWTNYSAAQLKEIAECLDKLNGE